MKDGVKGGGRRGGGGVGGKERLEAGKEVRTVGIGVCFYRIFNYFIGKVHCRNILFVIEWVHHPIVTFHKSLNR